MDWCWVLDLSLRTRCEFCWENFGIPGKGKKSGMKEKERKWKERKKSCDVKSGGIDEMWKEQKMHFLSFFNI